MTESQHPARQANPTRRHRHEGNVRVGLAVSRKQRARLRIVARHLGLGGAGSVLRRHSLLEAMQLYDHLHGD